MIRKRLVPSSALEQALGVRMDGVVHLSKTFINPIAGTGSGGSVNNFEGIFTFQARQAKICRVHNPSFLTQFVLSTNNFV